MTMQFIIETLAAHYQELAFFGILAIFFSIARVLEDFDWGMKNDLPRTKRA